jgi:hypothetical protein
MTEAQTFQLVSLGSQLLQTVVPIVLVAGLPRPRRLLHRAVAVILFAWGAHFFYTGLIYNPAGIAFAIEQGMDSPEMKFDNNTTGVSLILGWIIPAVSVCVFLWGRHLWQRPRNGAAKSATP